MYIGHFLLIDFCGTNIIDKT